MAQRSSDITLARGGTRRFAIFFIHTKANKEQLDEQIKWLICKTLFLFLIIQKINLSKDKMIKKSDNEDIACYCCKHFLYEGIDGDGYCDQHSKMVFCDEVCECHKLKDSFK